MEEAEEREGGDRGRGESAVGLSNLEEEVSPSPWPLFSQNPQGQVDLTWAGRYCTQTPSTSVSIPIKKSLEAYYRQREHLRMSAAVQGGQGSNTTVDRAPGWAVDNSARQEHPSHRRDN